MTGGERYARKVAANVAFWHQYVRQLSNKNLAALAAERQNLFRAVTMGLKVPSVQPAAAQLALTLLPFIEIAHHTREWLPILQRAIAVCSATEWALQAELWNGAGILYRRCREWRSADHAHRQALDLATRNHSGLLEGQSLAHLSAVASHNERPEEAETFGLAALANFQQHPPAPTWLGFVWNTLGKTAADRTDHETAIARYQQAADAWRQGERPFELARVLSNWGVCLQLCERFQEALPLFTEAQSLLENEPGGSETVVQVAVNLAALQYKLGDLKAAETTYRSVDLSGLQRAGDRFWSAITAQGVGNVLQAQGRHGEAEGFVQQAIDLWDEEIDGPQLANSLGTLAEIRLAQENIESMCQLLRRALTIVKRYPEDSQALTQQGVYASLFSEHCQGKAGGD